jgi:hypothetical protein
MLPRRHDAGRSPGLGASLVAVLWLLHVGCSGTDHLTADNSSTGSAIPVAAASTGASGIPFGTFALPLTLYGSTYTGGHLNPVTPDSLLPRLAVIRSAGARAVVTFVGGAPNYTNADGTFNFDLWKARVDRFRTVDFSSYISDGTIIGNYLVDEPDCSMCWGGQDIPQQTVEAMAEYSKSIWPTLPTVVRAEATWLQAYTGQYVHLDAAWAQYVLRKGEINTYLANNVAAAQSEGVGLLVGLNVLKGGSNQTSLTATQVKTFGSVLLGSSYACAFISWKYDAAYFSDPDISTVMQLLSKKAKRHPTSSCQR